MTTIRQIERTWSSQQYDRLFHDLMACRSEGSLRMELDVGRTIAAASAMAMIRMDELCQAHLPFYSKLVAAVIVSQEADGGWGDLTTTALCIRALMCGKGQGESIERGLQYLANLQKAEGIWPNIPLRRMPEEPYLSAFLLFQLGDQLAFQQSVRLVDALHWFDAHESELDADTRSLWERARLRCRRISS